MRKHFDDFLSILPLILMIAIIILGGYFVFDFVANSEEFRIHYYMREVAVYSESGKLIKEYKGYYDVVQDEDVYRLFPVDGSEPLYLSGGMVIIETDREDYKEK